MCGNNIQRVKIVVYDKIIEQVTEFKYLGYCISEYKRGLEDKLQTYNKINEVIRRHFGKQMTKETKLYPVQKQNQWQCVGTTYRE